MPAAMAKDKACSDIASTTQISPALTQRLQECGLSQLQVLLEIRGICTVEDLAKLDACESTILLQKARKIYEILGLASSPLETAISRLCNNALGNTYSCATSSGILKPGLICSEGNTIRNDAASAVDVDYATNSSSGSIFKGASQVIDQATNLQEVQLPKTSETDCKARKQLAGALDAALGVIGHNRRLRAVQFLLQSDDLASAAAWKSAKAFAAISIDTSGMSEDNKKLLKAAKLAVRDVILLRCCAVSIGVDSRSAVRRAIEEACSQCNNDTVSQVMMAHKRIFGDPTKASSRPKAEMTTPKESEVPVPRLATAKKLPGPLAPGSIHLPSSSPALGAAIRHKRESSTKVPEVAKDATVEAFKLFAQTAFRQLAHADNKQLGKCVQWLSEVMDVSDDFVSQGLQNAVLKAKLAMLEQAGAMPSCVMPETDSDDDDQKRLQDLETRLDRENGADAENEQTFGAEDAETTWTFEDALAANERLAASNHCANEERSQEPIGDCGVSNFLPSQQQMSIAATSFHPGGCVHQVTASVASPSQFEQQYYTAAYCAPAFWAQI